MVAMHTGPEGLGICQGHGLRVDRHGRIDDLTDLRAKIPAPGTP